MKTIPRAKTFYYVATPYGKLNFTKAFNTSAKMGAILFDKGHEIFVPIVHSHPISLVMEPQEHSFWIDRDRPLMRAASGLIVCKVPGWSESKGIATEIKYFKRAKKPVYFYDPKADEFTT